MTILISDNLFGVVACRKGKRWQASAEDKDGEWTPWCDGATPEAAIQSAVKQLPAPVTRKPKRDDKTEEMDFG